MPNAVADLIVVGIDDQHVAGLIPAGDPTAVGRPRNRSDVIAVAVVAADRLGGREIPHHHEIGVAAGDQFRPVVRKRQTFNAAAGLFPISDQSSGREFDFEIAAAKIRRDQTIRPAITMRYRDQTAYARVHR